MEVVTHFRALRFCIKQVFLTVKDASPIQTDRSQKGKLFAQQWARPGVLGRAGSGNSNVTIKDLSPFLILDLSMLSHHVSNPSGKILSAL